MKYPFINIFQKLFHYIHFAQSLYTLLFESHNLIYYDVHFPTRFAFQSKHLLTEQEQTFAKVALTEYLSFDNLGESPHKRLPCGRFRVILIELFPTIYYIVTPFANRIPTNIQVITPKQQLQLTRLQIELVNFLQTLFK